MYTVESLLEAYNEIADSIIEKHLTAYLKANEENPEYTAYNYFTFIYTDLMRELAHAGTGVFEKAVLEGLGTDIRLIFGIQKINLGSGEYINKNLL